MNPDHRRLQECVSSIDTCLSQAHFMLLALNYDCHIVRYRRERQAEACALSSFTLHSHGAAEFGDHLVDDHQPQTGSASATFRGVEWIEDVFHHLRSHS